MSLHPVALFAALAVLEGEGGARGKPRVSSVGNCCGSQVAIETTAMAKQPLHEKPPFSCCYLWPWACPGCLAGQVLAHTSLKRSVVGNRLVESKKVPGAAVAAPLPCTCMCRCSLMLNFIMQNILRCSVFQPWHMWSSNAKMTVHRHIGRVYWCGYGSVTVISETCEKPTF